MYHERNEGDQRGCGKGRATLDRVIINSFLTLRDLIWEHSLVKKDPGFQ